MIETAFILRTEKVLLLQAERTCDCPLRAVIASLLESPLQPWDNVLALQARSNEPNNSSIVWCVVLGWVVAGRVNLAARSIGRDTGTLE